MIAAIGLSYPASGEADIVQFSADALYGVLNALQSIVATDSFLLASAVAAVGVSCVLLLSRFDMIMVARSIT